MTTAAVTPLIVMSTITDALSVFVVGLFVFVFVFHSLEIVGELVAF